MSGDGNTPAQDAYDPSNDPPGIGRVIVLRVLGAVLLVVLAAAWCLHAFWCEIGSPICAGQ